MHNVGSYLLFSKHPVFVGRKMDVEFPQLVRA